MGKQRKIRVEPLHREVIDWGLLAAALLQLVSDEAAESEADAQPGASPDVGDQGAAA